MDINAAPSQQVKKTWKPTAAGILNIIAGSYVLVSWLLVFFAFAADALPREAIAFTFGILLFVYIIAFIIVLAITLILSAGAILALIGGYFATQRRRWSLALAGSIAACLSPLLLLLLFISGLLIPLPHRSLLIILSLLGITAIVLIALSKKEFK